MFVVDSVDTMAVHADELHSLGRRIGFVPTMGSLHAGHMALVRKALAESDAVIVSVFVNPLQFDRAEDLDAYPRDQQADARRLEEAGVAVLFVPTETDMYPLGRDAEPLVAVPGLGTLAADMEGAHRPGHFAGVVTVVKKLFDIIQPDIAVFGEKDFQQLRVVQHMVTELNLPVEIIVGETVREADGLAMSSRNAYLSSADRQAAPVLYRVLIALRDSLHARPSQRQAALQRAEEQLLEAGFKPEYLTVRNATDLREGPARGGELRILAAAWLGEARLIDNIKV